MWHPVDSLPFFGRCGLILLLAVAFFAVQNVMQDCDKQLRGTEEHPGNPWLQVSGFAAGTPCSGRSQNEARAGIVDFELARTVDESQCIVDSWKAAGIVPAARRSLHWDFVFIVSYVLLFSYLWVLAAQGFYCVRAKFTQLKLPYVAHVAFAFMTCGTLFSFAQWAAGLLDVIENSALLYMLDQGVSAPWPWIATSAAYVKFYLVMVLSGPLFAISVLVGVALAGWSLLLGRPT